MFIRTKSVDMHTNVQIAQGTIPSSSVITNNSYLYSLGSSPICVHEVDKSLSFYLFGNVKTELIQGLNHGFKLQYNGPQGFQSGPVHGTFTRLRSCIVPAEITEPSKISGGQNNKYDRLVEYFS